MYKIKKDESGVFSNFLRAIDWFWYSHYTNDKVCIDWNLNGKDLLGEIFDIKQNCENIIYETNCFVEKANLPLNGKVELRRKQVPFYSKYGGYFFTTPELYFEKDFQYLRNEMYKGFLEGFEFKNSFKSIEETNLIKNPEKTLGVHLRNPIHYRHSNKHSYPIQVDTSNFFSEAAKFIESQMNENGFENLYIACENSELFSQVKSLIGEERILSNPVPRSNQNIDWMEKSNFDMEEEVRNCFIDVYNLTKCKKALGSTSNMFLGVLVMNPEAEYEIFPIVKELHGF